MAGGFTGCLDGSFGSIFGAALGAQGLHLRLWLAPVVLIPNRDPIPARVRALLRVRALPLAPMPALVL